MQLKLEFNLNECEQKITKNLTASLSMHIYLSGFITEIFNHVIYPYKLGFISALYRNGNHQKGLIIVKSAFVFIILYTAFPCLN